MCSNCGWEQDYEGQTDSLELDYEPTTPCQLFGHDFETDSVTGERFCVDCGDFYLP